MAISETQILDALRSVRLPQGGDLVGAGMVSGLTLREGHVSFAIEVDPTQATVMEPVRKAAEKARRPFEPALAFFTDEAQAALVSGLLEDKTTRREFGRLLTEGASGWLRKEAPRAVVVTLRDQGAVVFSLDGSDPVPEPVAPPAWARDSIAAGPISW